MNHVVAKNLKTLVSIVRLALIAILVMSLLPALPVAAADNAGPAAVEQRTAFDAPAAAPSPAFGAVAAQTARSMASAAAARPSPVEAPDRAPDAPVITATKTDALQNDVPPAGPTAGDTIRYTVTVVNSGSDPASGVAFSDTIDPGTTLSGVAHVSPIAFDDSYDSLGNVGITVPANGVLANDVDPDSSVSLSVVAAAGATSQGGAFAIAVDGSFSYQPPAGYEGPDNFTYTLTDNDPLTPDDTGAVNITVNEVIWFINNTAAGPGNGTLNDPFTSIAGFNNNAADQTDDIIFVYQGVGSYPGAFTLLNSQQLIGQGVNLASAAGLTVPTFSNPLPGATANSLLTNLSGNSIALGSNNVIKGLTVGNTSGTGIYAPFGFGTLTVRNVAISGSGAALELATGTLDAIFDNIASSGASAAGWAISLNTVGGSLAVSNPGAGTDTGITSAGFGGISIINAPAGASYNFGETSVGSSDIGVLIQGNNAGATTTFANLAITVSNGTGLTTNNAGVISIGGTASTISATNGSAMVINGQANFGAGATFAGVSSTNGPTGVNLIMTGVTGSLTMNGGSITGSTSAGVAVSGGSANVTYAGSISNSINRSASIIGRTGGSVTLSGAIADTGSGILVENNSGGSTTFSGSSKVLNTGTSKGVTLNNNSGHTITFSNGGLDIDTTSGTGFEATGGAAGVNVTGTGNSINSTSGRAVNITSTTIGASGITFQSVSASNTSKGVVLNTTGSGAFTVTGVGVTDGSGGTIQTITQRGFEAISAQNIALSNMNFTNATTTNGVAPGTATCNTAEPGGFTNTGCNAPIYLETVTGVSLTNLTINGSAQNGINGNNVTNFSLVNSDLSNIGNESLENGIQFLNLLGSNTFNNVSIVGSRTRNALIENVQGTSTINLLNSTINTAVLEDGFFVKGASRSGNNATVILLVEDSSFTHNHSNQLKVHAEESSNVTATIRDNTFDGEPTIVGNTGIDLAVRDRATLNFDVLGTRTGSTSTQTFLPIRGQVVNVFASGGGTATGTISGNDIQGSDQGAGIRVVAEVTDVDGSTPNVTLNPTIVVDIDNNDISGVKGTGLAGIHVDARDGGGSVTGVARIDATINDNDVVSVDNADAAMQVYVSDITANHGNTVCANITNNFASGVDGDFGDTDFYYGNPPGGGGNFGVGQMQGFTSNVATTWTNNGNTDGGHYVGSEGTITGGTCNTVPPAPVHTSEGNQLSVISDQSPVGSDQTSAAARVSRVPSEAASVASAPASLFNLPIDQPSAPVFGSPAPAAAASRSTNLPIPNASSASRAPESGETINVNIGALPAGASVTIVFEVIIDTPTTPQEIVSQVCNQGTFSGGNFSNVLTDDPDTGTAADPTCMTLQPGSITIAKDQSPDGNSVFGFTSTIPGNASFNVNGDSSLPIANITAGSFTVTENNPAPLFTLTVLTCNDGASGVPSTVNLGTRTATVNLEPGESITCTFTNTQAGVDLQITKSDGGVTVEPGDTITYTLAYTNAGTGGATGVVLTETVPANTTFNPGASTAGWVCVPDGNAGSTCTRAVGAVAGSGNGSATFAVDVDNPVPAQTTEISNTACIGDDGSLGPDQNPGDNCGDDTTPLQSGSITIAKVTNPAGGTSFNFGGDLGTFSLNDGQQQPFDGLPSGDYDVTEIVPAGWSLTSVVCTGGDSTPITDGVTVNLDPGENITCTFTNTQLRVDLQITKSDGGVTVEPGDTITYTLSYTNAGNGGATGVVLTETVPSNTTFNPGASTAGWVCVPDGNAGSTCTLAVGAVAGSGNGSATFAVDVDNPLAPQISVTSNTVCIGDDGSLGPDQNPNDNCGDDTTTLQAASITISKITNPTGGTGFNFTGDLGAFSLNHGQVQIFPGLSSGDYDVTEVVPGDWVLAGVVCTGGGYTLIAGGVTVNLDPGENISCTFTNQQLPLLLELSKDVNGPTSVTLPGGSGAVSYTVAYTSTAVVTGTAVFTDTPSIDLGAVTCSPLNPAQLGPGQSGSQVVDCAVTITPDRCVALEAILNNTVVADFTPLDGFGASAPPVTITVPPSDPNNPLCNPQFSIVLTKTVGLDPLTCAVDDMITVPSGGVDVTYCYTVQNTGNISMTVHDLVDTELGTILSSFPYTLTPGATHFVTATANIVTTTVNTATWTATSLDPTGVAGSTDSATVVVMPPTAVRLSGLTAGSGEASWPLTLPAALGAVLVAGIALGWRRRRVRAAP